MIASRGSIGPGDPVKVKIQVDRYPARLVKHVDVQPHRLHFSDLQAPERDRSARLETAYRIPEDDDDSNGPGEQMHTPQNQDRHYSERQCSDHEPSYDDGLSAWHNCSSAFPGRVEAVGS